MRRLLPEDPTRGSVDEDRRAGADPRPSVEGPRRGEETQWGSWRRRLANRRSLRRCGRSGRGARVEMTERDDTGPGEDRDEQQRDRGAPPTPRTATLDPCEH